MELSPRGTSLNVQTYSCVSAKWKWLRSHWKHESEAAEVMSVRVSVTAGSSHRVTWGDQTANRDAAAEGASGGPALWGGEGKKPQSEQRAGL